MLKRLSCYMTGGHQAEIAREGGSIFLLCEHCGWRSPGIELQQSHGRGSDRRGSDGANQMDMRLPLFSRSAK